MNLSFRIVYILRFEKKSCVACAACAAGPRYVPRCPLTKFPLISVNRKHKRQKQPYYGTGTFGSWNLAGLVRPRLHHHNNPRLLPCAPLLIRGTRPAYPHHVLGHVGLCISFFGLVICTLRNYTEVCRKACVAQRFADVTVELETRCDRDEVRATGSIRTSMMPVTWVVRNGARRKQVAIPDYMDILRLSHSNI